jgi:hypothetical protein
VKPSSRPTKRRPTLGEAAAIILFSAGTMILIRITVAVISAL